MVHADEITIRARDGYHLAATIFRPDEGENRCVIIASATGVRRGLYEPYARYLARNGLTVITFDYRGIGGSLREPIERSKATILDWGRYDYAGVFDFAAKEFPTHRLCVVGHSVGGQLLGMLEHAEKIDVACTIASQNAYYRFYPPSRALKYGALWHLGVPVVARVFQHFPSKALKLGEDLPRGVALDWARFARHPDYLVDERGKPLECGFESLRAPILAFSFADDHRAPATNVRALHSRFKRSRVTLRDVAPETLGVTAIGHIGFFLSAHRKTLWKESLDWLRTEGFGHEHTQ
jgi:predicted alpha/beta hydrolase